jgi:uncharacterized membrane-anchored protein YhcB (DUF1043 family)
MIRALIGILAFSLSCAFAVASEPPTKPKPTAQTAVSAKRQAKLDAIHAKRKAASERKRNSVVNQDASASSLEASIRNTKEKVISHQAAGAIKMQVDADNRQLQQQQPILTAEQALWNQERQVLLKELSGQGIIDGPNGGMLRGDGLPALQVPSFGGMQVPPFGGLQVPSLGGLQVPSFGGLQLPSFGGLQVPSFGGLQVPSFGALSGKH